MNTARSSPGGTGLYTAALAFGGSEPPESAKTEEWNGVSWVEVADLSTARQEIGAGGTTTAGLATSGYANPADTASTEEWSGSSNVTKTIDTD